MSENLNLQTVDTVDTRPFRKLVMTIGELPTSFVESMTYYELLAWFTNYLETVIIPTVNNNAECVEELQTNFITLKNDTETEISDFETSITGLFNQLKDYVDNYFDNLDVQEEINNKLDAMAEDGTLQEIIDAYIQTNVAWIFDTVADMKASTNLINGSYAQTLGYYTANDGGGAVYKITNTESNNDYQETLNSGLYATLIVKDNILNVKTVGAKSDASFDNTTAFNTALNYANKYAIFFPYGFYRTSYLNSVTVNTNLKIYGDNTTIKLLDNVITEDGQKVFNLLCADNINVLIEMNGLNIDMNYTNNHSVIDTSGDPLALQHCHAIFVYGSSNSNIDVMIHDITFNDLIADGINLGGDSTKIVNKAIINNIISQNRTPLRSDVCITCDFDSLVCSDMVLDRFEIEVNSRRSNTKRTVLLNNLELKLTLDLDIGNNDGENVLYANNIRVNHYFYTDIENATYTNCTFKLASYIRILGKKIQFINCDFYTESTTEFTVPSVSPCYILVTMNESDLRFKNCNVIYNNTILSTTESTRAAFIRASGYFSNLEIDGCTFSTSSMVAHYRGGLTNIHDCIFNTSNANVKEFFRFESQTSNAICDVYLRNNTTSTNIVLLEPPISGSAVTIYENNPAWNIGKVLGFTRFDKITSFNGGSGSQVTVKELTEFYKDSIPTNGIWVKGQIVKNSNPSTTYMWVCTASGNFDSGSTTPSFTAVNL